MTILQSLPKCSLSFDKYTVYLRIKVFSGDIHRSSLLSQSFFVHNCYFTKSVTSLIPPYIKHFCGTKGLFGKHITGLHVIRYKLLSTDTL